MWNHELIAEIEAVATYRPSIATTIDSDSRAARQPAQSFGGGLIAKLVGNSIDEGGRCTSASSYQVPGGRAGEEIYGVEEARNEVRLHAWITVYVDGANEVAGAVEVRVFVLIVAKVRPRSVGIENMDDSLFIRPSPSLIRRNLVPSSMVGVGKLYGDRVRQ